MYFKQIKKKSLIIIILIMVFYVSLTIISDIEKTANHFSNIKFEIIPLVLGIQFLSLILRGIRQKKLLDEINVKLSFKENLKIYFAGISFISTPLGLGQVVKSQLIKELHGISRSKTLPVIILERFFDIFAITMLVIFTIIQFFSIQSAVIVLISLVIISIAYVILMKGNLGYITKKISKISFLKKILPSDEIYESLHTSLKFKKMISSLGLSLVIWSIDAVGVYLAFLSFNIDINFIQSIQYYLTSLVYGTISFLPGGVGLTEGSLIAQLMTNGFDFSFASSMTVFVRLTTIWFATILGLLVSSLFINKISRKNDNE
jgi:uncharacterized protein (TIRG00374 family)|tara:strand:+ start:3626 stop:4579 length:954 start_codon:yes stop_codon:yes gene_type:complete